VTKAAGCVACDVLEGIEWPLANMGKQHLPDGRGGGIRTPDLLYPKAGNKLPTSTKTITCGARTFADLA